MADQRTTGLSLGDDLGPPERVARGALDDRERRRGTQHLAEPQGCALSLTARHQRMSGTLTSSQSARVCVSRTSRSRAWPGLAWARRAAAPEDRLGAGSGTPDRGARSSGTRSPRRAAASPRTCSRARPASRECGRTPRTRSSRRSGPTPLRARHAAGARGSARSGGLGTGATSARSSQAKHLYAPLPPCLTSGRPQGSRFGPTARTGPHRAVLSDPLARSVAASEDGAGGEEGMLIDHNRATAPKQPPPARTCEGPTLLGLEDARRPLAVELDAVSEAPRARAGVVALREAGAAEPSTGWARGVSSGAAESGIARCEPRERPRSHACTRPRRRSGMSTAAPPGKPLRGCSGPRHTLSANGHRSPARRALDAKRQQ